MKTCAGIVLYNPDIKRLKENMDSIIGQVDYIVLADNGSRNIHDINNLISNYSDRKIFLIQNKKNEGIAKALNQILTYAKENDIEWFLTLDQDTISNDGLVQCYLNHISDSIGQLSCNIIDRNIGVLDEVKDYKGKDTTEIDFCITSGCFNNTRALLKVGGYREGLFIDGVDLDISCNLRNHGYKIVNVNFNGILHELGAGQKRTIMGVKFVIAHHVPWRNYYARRNIIFVARKYYKGISKIKMIGRQVVYGVGTVILEDKKIERLKMNLRGIIDGFKMPID